MPVPTTRELRQRAGEAGVDGLRVAVVGGGIAGLAAAYRLGLHHRVTVYERSATPGLSAHGVEIGGERVDIPLRVFTEGHYLNLLGLYEELGVATEAIDHSCSFAVAGPDGRPSAAFLQYGVGPEGTAEENVALDDRGRALAGEHRAFVATAAADLGSGLATGVTLKQYLERAPISAEYARCFVVPSFAAICTCRFETAERFPADVALELLLSGMRRLGLRRVHGGASAAAAGLLARIDDFRASAGVRGIEREGEAVRVTEADGTTRRYDHVVMATQANQVAGLVELSPHERRVLESVRYERVRVVVHGDARLLPDEPARGAFNFVVDPVRDETSATIWVNAIQPALERATFQTVNPLIEPRADTVVADVTLERAQVSAENAAIGAAIEALHREPGRRLWFCGSYATRGVPLLETGVTSANAVAAHIGGGAEPARAAAT